MDIKLIFKSVVLFSLFLIGPLSSDTQFNPAATSIIARKLIQDKQLELQLLIDSLNAYSDIESLDQDLARVDTLNKKERRKIDKILDKTKAFFKITGSGLKSLSGPIKRGIGRGFESFTSKVTGKAIPLGLGCVIFWLFWGRHNKQSIFLPITTAYKIIKPIVWNSKKEIRTNTSLRAFDTAIKHGWNWLANKFGRGVDNLVLDEETNRISMEPGLSDKFMALSFLLLANFIF